MKLKRRFYDSSINFSNISTERLVLGVLIGLAYAFAIYGFAYLVRESIRLMSSGFGHLPNILNENERNIYNWFFAALSLIFGNSIAISIILGGTNHCFGKKQIKNRRIINDQLFLNSSFAFWFLKISYIIGIFSMSFTDFNFLPEFIGFIIILIIVLYLEIWKTLSLVLRRKRFKIMIVHFILFMTFSYGLSNFELIDYEHLDKNQLKFKPLIELPKSEYNNVSFFDYYSDVYLKEEDRLKLSFRYHENYLNDSYLDFIEYKGNLYEPYQEKMAIRVSAFKDTKMQTIKLIEDQVKKADINYLIWATFEKDLSATRFSNNGIKIKLKDKSYQEFDVLSGYYLRKARFFKTDENNKPNDTIIVQIGKDLLINGVGISKNKLIENFESKINKNIIFQYEFNSDTKYQDYITVLSYHLAAIDSLREKNSKVELKFDNEKIRYTNMEEFLNEKQQLRYEFPFLMTEKYK
ncbi:hypothetical protein [Algibacter sp. 2305UL17-15]|uniref:hypothetical protein n=1 Tax=Algibacter sp. 2305UL17-15 TaxID=3231268 RepID=UPI003457EEA7